jgi:hypothetical protein
VTFYRASDIDVMLAEFGVDVTVGATTAKAIVDVSDESVLQGQAADFVGEVVTITVKSGVFATLAEGDSLTADGVNYRVMRVQRVDDGALTLAHVARS